MLVWFDRAENFSDQPENFIVGLEGRFDSTSRKVSLHLMMFGGGDVEIELWSKSAGSSMQAEDDIDPNDIYGKYSGKVAASIEELPKSFPDLLALFQKKLTEQAGHPVYFDLTERKWFASASDLPEAP